MKLLIFKTDIDSSRHVHTVEHVFNEHHGIINWFVDLEDIDNVLKIKGLESLTETDVQQLLDTKGFYCEPLPD